MSVDCYSLKYVKIKNEEVGARPIGWDSEDIDGFGTNSEGEMVCANKWMTTCPYCANLIELEKNQVVQVVENKKSVEMASCPHCNAGADSIPVSEGMLDESDPVDAETLLSHVDLAEFVDPLDGEIEFGFEVDFERMPGVV